MKSAYSGRSQVVARGEDHKANSDLIGGFRPQDVVGVRGCASDATICRLCVAEAVRLGDVLVVAVGQSQSPRWEERHTAKIDQRGSHGAQLCSRTPVRCSTCRSHTSNGNFSLYLQSVTEHGLQTRNNTYCSWAVSAHDSPTTELQACAFTSL